MIERIFVSVLLVVAGGMWWNGSGWFWLPLILGIVAAIFIYRMENKTYRINDDYDYYEVVDAKLTDDRE